MQWSWIADAMRFSDIMQNNNGVAFVVWRPNLYFYRESGNFASKLVFWGFVVCFAAIRFRGQFYVFESVCGGVTFRWAVKLLCNFLGSVLASTLDVSVLHSKWILVICRCCRFRINHHVKKTAKTAWEPQVGQALACGEEGWTSS